MPSLSKLTQLVLSLVLLAGVIYLVQLNVSVETHLWLSVSAFVVVIALMKTTSTHLRAFTMLLGAFISVRYIVWRFSESLPWESALDLPFAMLLLIAECYGVLIYLLGMAVTIKTFERKITPIDPNAPLPSVDIYIPTYDESPEVVKPTLLAATKLDYPGVVNVYLLDDGGTHDKLNHNDAHLSQQAKRRAQALQQFCTDVGAHYLTRANNQGAKAGNINHALEHTDGELLLILDADHVPTRDFLTNTIGLFQSKPKLGFVQTPHFFVTPNPMDRNLGITHQVQPENEMFYNKILLGMDYWNGCFFCGSAAVIRRSALLDVGGIDTKTITEDADTALNIHAKGWDSAYLNIAMVAGLSPDTFGAYVTQRARWSQGMIQIFLLNNPLFRSGLSLPQRLCYLNSTLYWFFPLFRSIFLISPLLYLLLDLQIFVGNAWDFLVYVVPHLLISMLLTQQIFGKTRQAFFSELYETALSIYLLLPVIAVLLQPRKPSFKVTPKGETTEHTSFSTLTPVMLVTFTLVALGEAWGLYRYFNYAEEQSQLILVLIFNTLNLILVVLCLGGMLERQQRRKEPRMPANERAHVKMAGSIINASLTDVSMGGAKVTLDTNSVLPVKGEHIELQYLINLAKSTLDKPRFKRISLPMVINAIDSTQQGTQLCCKISEQRITQLAAQYSKTYAQSEHWRETRLAGEKMELSIIGSIAHLCRLATRNAARLCQVSWQLKRRDGAQPVKGVTEK